MRERQESQTLRTADSVGVPLVLQFFPSAWLADQPGDDVRHSAREAAAQDQWAAILSRSGKVLASAFLAGEEAGAKAAQGFAQAVNVARKLDEQLLDGWHPSQVVKTNNSACMIQAIVSGALVTLPLVVLTLRLRREEQLLELAGEAEESAEAQEARAQAARPPDAPDHRVTQPDPATQPAEPESPPQPPKSPAEARKQYAAAQQTYQEAQQNWMDALSKQLQAQGQPWNVPPALDPNPPAWWSSQQYSDLESTAKAWEAETSKAGEAVDQAREDLNQALDAPRKLKRGGS